MTSESRLWPGTGSLLTPDLAAEVGVVAATVRRNGQELRAWLDPGPNFERTVTISDERDLDGSFGIVVCQRYRPYDPIVCVVAADIRSEHAADDLHQAVDTARERDPYRAHWLCTYQPVEPPWSVKFSVANPDTARAAMRTAESQAASTSQAHHLYNSRANLICANNPPPEGTFFSVTPGRRWSTHAGETTQPLRGRPGITALGFRPAASASVASVASVASSGGAERRRARVTGLPIRSGRGR